MNALLKHRHIVRENFLMLIGVCLCVYFSYHALQGNRSMFKLMLVESQIETLSQKYDILQEEKSVVEQKVAMMRPGSVNKDLLEERAMLILGYRHKDDVAIISN